MGLERYQALSFLRIEFVEFGYGLLHAIERPADGLADRAKYYVLVAEGRRGRLGIFEPGEGFGGGSFFSGGRRWAGSESRSGCNRKNTT